TAAHQRVVTEVERLAKRQGEEPAIYDAYKKFLDEFPESEYASAFRKLQSEARDGWDNRVWGALDADHKRTIDAITLKKRVEEYLSIPGAARRVEAMTFLGAAEGELDKAEYGVLAERAKAAQDGAALEAVDALARQYLDPRRGIKRMAPAVKAWRDWFDRL